MFSAVKFGDALNKGLTLRMNQCHAKRQWPRLFEHVRNGCPLRGVSGILRKYAYQYSEGRAVHWLILPAADRVEAGRSHLRSLLTLHPDNPITETGVLSEFTRHGLSSRFGQRRADLAHQPLDR